MTTMYCPKCDMNVFAIREDLDIGLIIILCIFTAGIGAIIYLAIYYDKDANRCIHCKSICRPISIGDSSIKPVSQIKCHLDEKGEKKVINQAQIKDEKTKYCFNCGTELDERERLNFCAYCGTRIN